METDELKHMIEKKLRHSYVERYIQKPFIDIDKVFVLNYLYNDLQMPNHTKQQYIITVMLVQIALDTHELVPANGSTEMTETEQQLSVLAGDYYSGLYYLLLSELEDIEMVRHLAAAIKLINEQKIKLFYEDMHTLEDVFTTIENIESLLFTKIANALHTDKDLLPIITELLMINRLYMEKENIQQHKFSYIEKYIKNNSIGAVQADAIEIIENEIDHRKHHIETLLLRLPYHFITFKNIIRNKVKLSYNTTVAEEG